MRKLVFIFFLSLIYLHSVNSQAYQILGKDNTGNNIESALPGLIEVADRLIDSLPEAFEDDFKVYSISFYLHNKDFEGGIPSIFLSAIDSVDNLSPYSLLIGRQMSETYRNYKFWVRLKLPDTDLFQCFTENDFVFIQTKLHNILNKGLPNNSVNGFIQPEKDAMNELISIITKAKFCCQRNPIQCLECPDDIGAVRDMMEQFGFSRVPISGLTVTSKLDTTGNVEEYTQLHVQIEGQTVNVNLDVESFLNKLGNRMEGVKGTIYFYNPENTNCAEIIDAILQGTSEEYFSLVPGYHQINRTSPALYTFRVTVICTIDENGIPALHVRTEEYTLDHPSGKIIYLQCLDGCGLNMDDVRDMVENFYTLLGEYQIPGGGLISLVPTIQKIDWLHLEDVHQNTVVLFGDTSSLINFSRRGRSGYYVDIAPFFQDTYCEPCRFSNKHEYLLELGHPCGHYGVGRLSLVRKDLDAAVQKFRANSVDHLSAFLAFHATGHNACIDHFRKGSIDNNYYHMGYMSDANCIQRYYLGKAVLKSNCVESPNIFYTLESFVQETMETGEFDYEIKRQIYNRFIK